MTNFCYYSMQLKNLLSFRSTNCRNFCTICKYKQNSIKYLNNNNIIETNLKSRNYWFSASLLFKNNLKSFQSKNCFSTTFSRNERLSQIHRNVIKEKTQNSEPMNEWQELMKMSLFKRFKVMFKKYWYISIPVHCITSGLWFGLLYLIAKRFSFFQPFDSFLTFFSIINFQWFWCEAIVRENKAFCRKVIFTWIHKETAHEWPQLHFCRIFSDRFIIIQIGDSRQICGHCLLLNLCRQILCSERTH